MQRTPRSSLAATTSRRRREECLPGCPQPPPKRPRSGSAPVFCCSTKTTTCYSSTPKTPTSPTITGGSCPAAELIPARPCPTPPAATRRGNRHPPRPPRTPPLGPRDPLPLPRPRTPPPRDRLPRPRHRHRAHPATHAHRQRASGTPRPPLVERIRTRRLHRQTSPVQPASPARRCPRGRTPPAHRPARLAPATPRRRSRGVARPGDSRPVQYAIGAVRPSRSTQAWPPCSCPGLSMQRGVAHSDHRLGFGWRGRSARSFDACS